MKIEMIKNGKIVACNDDQAAIFLNDGFQFRHDKDSVNHEAFKPIAEKVKPKKSKEPFEVTRVDFHLPAKDDANA